MERKYSYIEPGSDKEVYFTAEDEGAAHRYVASLYEGGQRPVPPSMVEDGGASIKCYPQPFNPREGDKCFFVRVEDVKVGYLQVEGPSDEELSSYDLWEASDSNREWFDRVLKVDGDVEMNLYSFRNELENLQLEGIAGRDNAWANALRYAIRRLRKQMAA